MELASYDSGLYFSGVCVLLNRLCELTGLVESTWFVEYCFPESEGIPVLKPAKCNQVNLQIFSEHDPGIALHFQHLRETSLAASVWSYFLMQDKNLTLAWMSVAKFTHMDTQALLRNRPETSRFRRYSRSEALIVPLNNGGMRIE